jgi:hypothetical protein
MANSSHFIRGRMEQMPAYMFPEQMVTIQMPMVTYAPNLHQRSVSRSVSPANYRHGTFDGSSRPFSPNNAALSLTNSRPISREASPNRHGFTGYVESSKEVSPFMPKKPPDRRFASPFSGRSNSMMDPKYDPRNANLSGMMPYSSNGNMSQYTVIFSISHLSLYSNPRASKQQRRMDAPCEQPTWHGPPGACLPAVWGLPESPHDTNFYKKKFTCWSGRINGHRIIFVPLRTESWWSARDHLGYSSYLLSRHSNYVTGPCGWKLKCTCTHTVRGLSRSDHIHIPCIRAYVLACMHAWCTASRKDTPDSV